MVNYSELSLEQIGAIRRSINLGRTLQKDHPEIIDLYRNNKSQLEISQMFIIPSQYGVCEEIARMGVLYAIGGNNGYFKVEAYEGLADEEERIRLRGEHAKHFSSIAGLKLKEEGRGIFGRTDEERKEDKGKGGKTAFNKKVGIHGRSDEEKSIDGRKGGLKLMK